MFPREEQGYSVILMTVICEDWLWGSEKPSDDIFGLRIFVVTFLGLEVLGRIFIGGGGGGGREGFDKKQSRGSHFHDKRSHQFHRQTPQGYVFILLDETFFCERFRHVGIASGPALLGGRGGGQELHRLPKNLQRFPSLPERFRRFLCRWPEAFKKISEEPEDFRRWPDKFRRFSTITGGRQIFPIVSRRLPKTTLWLPH